MSTPPGGHTRTDTAADDALPGWLAGLGLTLLTVSGALSALLECTLVPLYAGTTVVPVAVVIAIVLNVLLPVLARTVVPRTVAAVAPFAAWLVVVIAVGAVARPEGDVLLPGGGPGGVAYVTYGVLLGGTLVGAITVVMLSNPPRRAIEPAGERARVSR